LAVDGGAFSTLLRQSGLRASTGGVLATKSERKMLASTIHACTRAMPGFETVEEQNRGGAANPYSPGKPVLKWRWDKEFVGVDTRQQFVIAMDCRIL